MEVDSPRMRVTFRNFGETDMFYGNYHETDTFRSIRTDLLGRNMVSNAPFTFQLNNQVLNIDSTLGMSGYRPGLIIDIIGSQSDEDFIDFYPHNGEEQISGEEQLDLIRRILYNTSQNEVLSDIQHSKYSSPGNFTVHRTKCDVKIGDIPGFSFAKLHPTDRSACDFANKINLPNHQRNALIIDTISSVSPNLGSQCATDPGPLFADLGIDWEDNDQSYFEDQYSSEENSLETESSMPSLVEERQLTPAEEEAISRLQELGFDRERAMWAYNVCNGNENSAANLLFSMNEEP